MARRSLGLCWYRCEGARERNNDGRHIGYLEQPWRFEHLDPVVFAAMRRIVGTGRSLDALESAALLPDATYHGDEVPRRAPERRAWFQAVERTVAGCDLVFIDADNGLEWNVLTPKCVARNEVRALLKPNRALLLYHHQTRRPGGAAAEYTRCAGWLFEAGASSVEAVRLRPYASRFYLLVDGDPALSCALKAFAARWANEAEHFARVIRP
jgi:hypothetical protein